MGPHVRSSVCTHKSHVVFLWQLVSSSQTPLYLGLEKVEVIRQKCSRPAIDMWILNWKTEYSTALDLFFCCVKFFCVLQMSPSCLTRLFFSCTLQNFAPLLLFPLIQLSYFLLLLFQLANPRAFLSAFLKYCGATTAPAIAFLSLFMLHVFLFCCVYIWSYNSGARYL